MTFCMHRSNINLEKLCNIQNTIWKGFYKLIRGIQNVALNKMKKFSEEIYYKQFTCF